MMGEAAPAMPGTTRAVFLSYRREETRHIAGRLADRLTERLGSTQVFMDVDTIEPGADFAAATVREVASCDVLIALIGPIWSTITDPRGRRRLDDPDDLVVLEIQTALEREIRVIPVLVDGAVMPERYDLPQGLQPLALRNAVRLDHETFRTDVATLLDAVERILATLKTAEPMVGTGSQIIDRAGTGRDRSAPTGIQASYRRWIAGFTRPTGVDTRAGRPPAERGGDGGPRSRELLAGGIAVVLLVVGVLAAMLISRDTPTDGTAAPPTSTTSLVVSPASPVDQGSPVTLTATITPSVAAGTVQFKDGVTNLGNPVIVSNGTVSATTSRLSRGSHRLTAVFSPSDPSAFSQSTSPPVNLTVFGLTDAMTATTTTLTVAPAFPVAQGSPVTLTATITPPVAAGTVQFKDGVTNLGNPVTVSNGTALGTVSTLSGGSHQLTAVFSPSDPSAFGPSTSPSVNFVVTVPG